jgi:hypothetical protein
MQGKKMIKKRRQFLWVLLITALFFKLGCVDVPKDLVAPKWDVPLNAPIANRTYTLWDAIKKDTSKLHTYRSGTNSGLLYYSDIKRIDPARIGDNLKVGTFSASTSASIGSINIPDPSPVSVSVVPREVSSGITYNVPTPFPPIDQVSINKSFSQSSEFQSVTIESGKLKFSLKNNFPVQITIEGLVIKNQTDNVEIVNDNAGFTLSSGASSSKEYTLGAGKTIYRDLVITAKISSTGSSGSNVMLNENTNLAITAQVENLVFSQVTSKLSQNTFNMNNTYTYNDSTKVQSAVINNGWLTITANNNLDVDLAATLTIPSLKKGGTSLTQVINLSRKQQNKSVPISLSGYTLTCSTVNTIQYSINVTSLATSDFRTIAKNDNVSARLDISELSFQSITGQLKPIRLTVNETSIDLGMGDVSDKLFFSQIDMENPSISLRLRKSTDMQINFSGQLIGRSPSHTAQVNIPNTTIGSGETIISLNPVEVRNFIKSFSGKLPTTVTVKGAGVANPNYLVSSVTNADSVYGTANIEFPMKVSITGGSFRDSSNVDLTDNDRTEMRKVSGGSLVMEIQNGIAFDASVSARLYDASNRFLMNLPPNRTPNDTLIHVQGAVVNSLGRVTSSTASKITFSLNKSEVELLTQSKYIISKISFYTSGNNSTPIEFRTSDAIQIKVYGNLNYTVEENK